MNALDKPNYRLGFFFSRSRRIIGAAGLLVLVCASAAIARADTFYEVDTTYLHPLYVSGGNFAIDTLDVDGGTTTLQLDDSPALDAAGDSYLENDVYIGGNIYMAESINAGDSTFGNVSVDQYIYYGGGLSLYSGGGEQTLVVQDGDNSITFDVGNQSINFNTFSINGTTADELSSLVSNALVFAGDYGFTVGNDASASGIRSAAFGGSANASGFESIALANGNATGNYSIAVGNSTASGVNSLSFGVNSTASANGSMVLGTGLTSPSWSSTSVGHYSDSANITGSNSTWVATDPAFVVGIGQNSTARANGLVVLNNGNTTISGNGTAGGDLSVSGNSTLSGANTTISGNASVGGDATVTGNLTISGNVTYSNSFGDVSMGVYGVYGE